MHESGCWHKRIDHNWSPVVADYLKLGHQRHGREAAGQSDDNAGNQMLIEKEPGQQAQNQGRAQYL